MFLQRLVLENVKAIKEIELPFVTPDSKTRKWTLLLGENGSGKTTVMQAIGLLLAGSEGLLELLGNCDSWIRLGQNKCLLRADLVTARGEERRIELTIRRGDKVKDVFLRNEKALNDLDSALEHSPRSYLTIGYGASRHISKQHTIAGDWGGSFRHSRAQSVATLFSTDAVLNSIESWAMALHYQLGDPGLQMIKKSLANLWPEATFESIDKERQELLFRTSEGIVPLSSLSDGYTDLAAWSGDLLYRITRIFSDYKDPFTARGLLLIDEIDLHLHPIWQRQLMTYLEGRLPNFQIVGTTYSPLTAHQAGEGELFVLRREDPQSAPTLYQYPGSPRTLMLHQLLLTPIFGLSTVDSTEVETMRNEYKGLSAQSASKMSRADKKREANLREQIEDLPDWSAQTDYDRKQIELLEEIQQTLQTRDK